MLSIHYLNTNFRLFSFFSSLICLRFCRLIEKHDERIKISFNMRQRRASAHQEALKSKQNGANNINNQSLCDVNEAKNWTNTPLILKNECAQSAKQKQMQYPNSKQITQHNRQQPRELSDAKNSKMFTNAAIRMFGTSRISNIFVSFCLLLAFSIATIEAIPQDGQGELTTIVNLGSDIRNVTEFGKWFE